MVYFCLFGSKTFRIVAKQRFSHQIQYNNSDIKNEHHQSEMSNLKLIYLKYVPTEQFFWIIGSKNSV